MEINRYDGRTRAIINEIQDLLPKEGEQVFCALKHLEKTALQTDDAALAGYTYLNFASANYYRERYDKIRPYLQRSLRYLLRTSENEYLTRAYNLFAVDAQRIGAFDIAYHYFEMALSFVAQDKDSVGGAVTNANLGDLMAEMGEFKEAIRHIKKSRRVMNRKKDTFPALQNSILIRTNLALYSFYAKDAKGAKKIMAGVEKDLKKIKDTKSRAHLWFLILKTHEALIKNKFDALRALTDEVITRIVESDTYALYSKDIYRLIARLIWRGAKKEAGKLIDAVDKVDTPDESYYALLLHEQIKIRYYRLTNNHKQLSRAYARRHTLAALQQEEMLKIYRDSTALMKLVEELRDEREEVIRENERLQQQADTDELTGLPNRYALNKAMEEAFARCKRRRETFGIGIVDIDAFKFYNDTFGHREGDACLRAVARALKTIADKDEMFVARYGGDEFVLLYEHKTEREIAQTEQKIMEACPVPVTHGKFNAVPSDEYRLWDFFARADAQMYKRKKAGR